MMIRNATTDRADRFALARNGSIFPDEIGELGLNSWVKLLRVLQDRTCEVLGDSQSRQLALRIKLSAQRRILVIRRPFPLKFANGVGAS